MRFIGAPWGAGRAEVMSKMTNDKWQKEAAADSRIGTFAPRGAGSDSVYRALGRSSATALGRAIRAVEGPWRRTMSVTVDATRRCVTR